MTKNNIDKIERIGGISLKDTGVYGYENDQMKINELIETVNKLIDIISKNKH